mmetsp:Transcript_5957/g.7055  ORF Transcript_5957/g.7055 Transcript_5957/m.7055 type:complete len:80 (-) Transcript_5957:55-294(-)
MLAKAQGGTVTLSSKQGCFTKVNVKILVETSNYLKQVVKREGSTQGNFMEYALIREVPGSQEHDQARSKQLKDICGGRV